MKTMKVLSIAALTLLISVASYAQTADEVIAKYLENTGGKAKWETLKSVKMSAKIKMQGMELPLTIAQKAPNKMMTVAEFQGMKFYQGCFDGTTMWGTNQMTMKAEKSETEESENMKDQAELLDPFINYAARGYKVVLEGKETAEGTECFKIKLTRKPVKVDGKDEENVTYYLIDTQNYVPIVVQSTIKKGPAKGTISETVFSDYQETDGGLMFPFSMLQRVKGQTEGQNIIFSKIETNIDLDDAMFAMPAEKAPEVKK
jgi:outer membrane lipoprotein-sorting protein